MGGLSGALNSAQRSLTTFSRGLAVIQDNIANAATPGYARQRVSLAPVMLPQASFGQGVQVTRVETMRSALLDYQVLSARQTQAHLDKTTEFYTLVEPSFRLDGVGDIGSSVDQFFTAAGALAVNPSDPHQRESMLAAGDALASSFRRTYSDVSKQTTTLDGEAQAVVRQINSLIQDFTQLQRDQGPPNATLPNSAVETRLGQVLEQLSELVGFGVQRQQDGTLALISGSTALAVGVNQRPLTVSIGSSIRIMDADGRDITASIEGQGGKLGAILEARNQALPELLGKINSLAKSVADSVNEQLSKGVDSTGAPGAPLFSYTTSYAEGSGRTAGVTGAATPAPPPSVTVDFSGGVTGSITATLDSFFAAAAPPSAAQAGDAVSIRLTSADGAIDRAITTAPLAGGETTADLAARLNDQISLDPELKGLVSFSDAGGNLKVTLSDQAKQGFSFTASTNRPGFTTGLEGGGVIGGQSAEEIAAALNEQVALQPALRDAGVRFSAAYGEVRLDGDIAFNFQVTDSDPAGTGFASGLDGVSDAAGGALAAGTLTLSNLSAARIATGTAAHPGGNGNIVALEGLAELRSAGGLTFNEFYAGVVRDVGGAAQSAESQLETQRQIVQSAETLRDSFSAVDVNEEAIQMLQFEQGYQAMLRVIQTLQGLTDEVLSLVR